MWPDSSFPKSVGSFARPVPVPTVDPHSNPNYQVCFRKEWLPYITGALSQLLLQSTWDTQDPAVRGLAQYRSALLIETFSQGCPIEVPTNGCVDYPMSSSIISWFPLDPYSHPNETPSGYSGPPFTVLPDDDVIFGYKRGDVIVSGFPQPDSGIFTVPAFGIDVIGTGVIEIHFINALLGGICAVTVDGDVAGTEYVELQADITSIPPESTEEVIHEITLTESGAHHVDCRFVPQFDDTATAPIRFGGAIRKVNLCGFDDMAFDVRQNPDNCGVLDKMVNGVDWEVFADINDCVKNITIVKEPKIWRIEGDNVQYSYNNITYNNYTDAQGSELGMPEPNAGVPTGVDAKCIRAKNNISFMLTTFNSIEKELSNAGNINSAISAIMGIIAVLGAEFLILPAALTALMSAATTGGSSFTMSLFSPSVLKQVTCDLEDAFGSDGSLTTSGYQTFLATTWAHGGLAFELITHWFEALGPIGMVAAGQSSKGGVSSCDDDPCSDDLIKVFNFLESPSGWQASLRDFQEVGDPITQGSSFILPASKWVAQAGWCEQATRYVGSNTWFWVSLIHLNLPHAINLTKIDVEYYFEHGLITAATNITPITMTAYHANKSQFFGYNVGPNYTDIVDGITYASFDFGTGAAMDAGSELKMKIYINPDMPYGPPYTGKARWRKITFHGTE
jgi:hypothetical protein